MTKFLLSTTVLLVFFAIATDCVQGNRRHSHLNQARLRRNGNTDADMQSATCVDDKCHNKILKLVINQFPFEGPENINEENVDKLCSDRDSVKQCIADNCTITSTFQAVVDVFGFVGYLCDEERSAFATHGACLVAAMQVPGDKLKECINHDALHAYLQAHSGAPPSGGSSSSRMHRKRRGGGTDAFVFPGNVFALALEKMRLAANAFPSDFTCQHLRTGLDCMVERAKEECDKDGKTEASEFFTRAYEQAARRVFKAVKALKPEKNLFSVVKCLEDGTVEPMSLFFQYLF